MGRSDSSSDEEDDHRNLIVQNHNTTFDIDNDPNFRPPPVQRFRFSMPKFSLNKSNAKQPSCFYPIPQAADCILRVIERTNAPVIYLSTDAADSETALLQSLLVLNGKPIPLVKRPPRNSAEKWDALLYRHGIEGDSQVEAMLDKTICAMSSAFIGASGSTFTEDILRLRKDWGSASLCDEYLCQGEEPNFIAEDG